MSNTMQKRFLIGTGQVWYGTSGAEVRLGSQRSVMSLIYTANKAYANDGTLADVASRIVGEEATMEVEIADFKLEQYRRAIAQAKSLASGTLASASTSANIRTWEESTATAIASFKTLSHETSIANIVLSTLDLETQYTSGTDYTATSTGQWKRKTAGTIGTAGTVILAQYTFKQASATRMDIGGREAPFEGVLIFALKTANNKVLNVRFHRAVLDGQVPLSTAQNEYRYTALRFKALADKSRSKGQQLFWVALEV